MMMTMQPSEQDVTALAFDWLKKANAQLNAIRSMQAWLLLASLVTALSTGFLAFALFRFLDGLSKVNQFLGGS